GRRSATGGRSEGSVSVTRRPYLAAPTAAPHCRCARGCGVGTEVVAGRREATRSWVARPGLFVFVWPPAVQCRVVDRERMDRAGSGLGGLEPDGHASSARPPYPARAVVVVLDVHAGHPATPMPWTRLGIAVGQEHRVGVVLPVA